MFGCKQPVIARSAVVTTVRARQLGGGCEEHAHGSRGLEKVSLNGERANRRERNGTETTIQLVSQIKKFQKRDVSGIYRSNQDKQI